MGRAPKKRIGRVASSKRAPDAVVDEIHSELRSIVRLMEDLSRPLWRFHKHPSRPAGRPTYYVDFHDNIQFTDITGAVFGGIRSLVLPDEQITGKAYSLSQAI